MSNENIKAEKMSEHPINSKKWNYDEITASMEGLIKEKMLEANEGTDIDKIVCKNMARGIYLSWRRLTVGLQRDGDSDRLEGLVGL